MPKMPERFFFVMDAHQGAVAIAVFSMFATVFMALSVGAAYHVIQPNLVVAFMQMDDDNSTETSEETAETAKMVFAVLPVIMWVVTVIFVLAFLIDAGMLMGVLTRKKCLLVPWLVLALLGLLSNLSEFFAAFEGPNVSAVLLAVLLIICQIGFAFYKLLVVFASYRLLGKPAPQHCATMI